MKTLQSRSDIVLLVDSFYKKVIADDLIGTFFNDISKVNWDQHLPTMYNFWESILFGNMTYKGNPMARHFPVNEIKAMERKHFDRWLALWTTTINEHFIGENANAAITKASNIANLMEYKMRLAREKRLL